MKFVATVLVTLLIALLPLAHASPVDPSGPDLWDNGDFDEIILFLTSDLHFLDTVHGPTTRASETVSEGISKPLTGLVAQRAHEPGTPRAPPAAY